MGRDIWRLVEREAAPAPFILGGRFSLADLYLGFLSRWMGGRQWIPANCPKVEAMAQAVAARPRIAPVWARHI
ncbi:glutathione S-transferase family protein [Paeniroseomonas aquatica]